MKNYLNLLGKKSRKAFSQKIPPKKKNKVLLDKSSAVPVRYGRTNGGRVYNGQVARA